jgi:hypothetical protein
MNMNTYNSVLYVLSMLVCYGFYKYILLRSNRGPKEKSEREFILFVASLFAPLSLVIILLVYFFDGARVSLGFQYRG